jgi:hypothetical protein
MSKKYWNRIAAIFNAALDLCPEERNIYLLNSCSGDFALLSEVESFLYAFEKGHFFR